MNTNATAELATGAEGGKARARIPQENHVCIVVTLDENQQCAHHIGKGPFYAIAVAHGRGHLKAALHVAHHSYFDPRHRDASYSTKGIEGLDTKAR